MHSKINSTQFGEPLSKESINLIQNVRQKLTYPIHSNFDNNFNIYRFVANAERIYKNKNDIIENAAKALSMHLRVRKCFNLDELPDIPFEQNPIFIKRLMPLSPILEEATDSSNRLLWFVEYKSLNVEAIANGIKSSESIRYQFWQFEHMLRRVNKQEKLTGCLSSIRHVIDMTGYEINPFTMLFVSSGTLSYYSQLLHYDNYPDLVYPIELVNIAKWIFIPYRLIKNMMPAGFKVYSFCIPMQQSTKIWQPIEPRILEHLEHLSIGPRKYKYFKIQINKEDIIKKHILSWYFRTDGIIHFGIFFEPFKKEKKEISDQNGNYINGNKYINNNNIITTTNSRPSIEHFENNKELAYMWFKLTAKIHHEWDYIECNKPGIYWIIFSNNHSWLNKRSIEVLINLNIEKNIIKRIWHDKEQTGMENIDLMKLLHVGITLFSKILYYFSLFLFNFVMAVISTFFFNGMVFLLLIILFFVLPSFCLVIGSCCRKKKKLLSLKNQKQSEEETKEDEIEENKEKEENKETEENKEKEEKEGSKEYELEENKKTEESKEDEINNESNMEKSLSIKKSVGLAKKEELKDDNNNNMKEKKTLEVLVSEAFLGKTDQGVQKIELVHTFFGIGLETNKQFLQEVFNNFNDWLSALHEGGHIICAWFSPNGLKVVKVTIKKEGRQAGRTDFSNSVNEGNKHQIMDWIVTLLGGYVAEELFNGGASTGSRNDIDVLTGWTLAQVKNFGMEQEYGPINFDQFTATERPNIFQLVNKKIKECRKIATKILKDHKEEHKKLTELIFEKKELDHEEIKALLGPPTNPANN
ncbi:CRAL-TRIO domain-containing protein [Meloidogyne graminicola]|uniref:CRAL-TRIO domain-containing protein n=1 Tax=Meloidogyne graminicola TaxID=189291 RepID=A0A8S9ZR17_9BILA|nr:CRAL-TRIO domain-containing protein [Meloidogyne graminicola]